MNLYAIELPSYGVTMSRRWRGEQTQSLERRRVDGVGRLKFDFHTGVDEVIDDSRRLVKAKREIARLRKRLQAAEQRARTPSPSPVRRPGRPTKPDPFEAAAAAAVERAERAEARARQCNNQISRHFSRLNYDLHTIATTPARRRGDAGSSLLDRASTAESSPRNDLVQNYRTPDAI